MGLSPYYEEGDITIYRGDCREILPSLKGISAVITDPPYELGFMNKGWDKQGVSFQLDTWRLIRESCLPGAMLLSFGGTRTSHRIACAIEDAGWQIRDTICWVYGSGFPKSLDISKAIDKQKGAKREIIGKYEFPDGGQRTVPRGANKNTATPNMEGTPRQRDITTPATPEAKLWEGYGTGLKPAYEPIIVAMNPLDGTFANNALKHKVAGFNIDKGRIETDELRDKIYNNSGDNLTWGGTYGKGTVKGNQKGRFPSNFIHDGSQEVMELFPDSKSTGGKGIASQYPDYDGHTIGSYLKGKRANAGGLGDSGSAARFFYCAKASRSERDEGLEDMPLKARQTMGDGIGGQPDRHRANNRNNHPTVKPLSLMTYLCKLVKMPYNLILDPFCGSGTTLLACKKLGIPCIGIDSNEGYCEIASKRSYAYGQAKPCAIGASE